MTPGELLPAVVQWVFFVVSLVFAAGVMVIMLKVAASSFKAQIDLVRRLDLSETAFHKGWTAPRVEVLDRTTTSGSRSCLPPSKESTALAPLTDAQLRDVSARVMVLDSPVPLEWRCPSCHALKSPVWHVGCGGTFYRLRSEGRVVCMLCGVELERLTCNRCQRRVYL